jgi:hypothetical protein
MENVKKPWQFSEWCTDKFDREEDAAYTFGNHLIKYCRDEVMNSIPQGTSEIEKGKIKDSIHNSLHNVWIYWKVSGNLIQERIIQSNMFFRW